MEKQIKKILTSLGADVCGIAHISRFQEAPEGFRPTDIFPACKAVISYGLALPKGLFETSPRLIYSHFNDLSISKTNEIAFESAKSIENTFSCIAIPLPADSPYEYWDKEQMEGRGQISMKHAAVNAGLGSIGKSSLLLNPKYGNRLTLGAILTDLNLTSDPLTKDFCIPGCQKCIKACPASAIHNKQVIQKLCRKNTYGTTARGFNTVDCNKCRTLCPLNT